MDSLLLLQFGCLVTTGLLALVLFLSGLASDRENALYERSRLLIVAALLLLCLHYVLQITFGFRSQGDDVGAMINILFYSPAIIILSISMRNLLLSRRSLHHHLIVSLSFYAAICVSAAVGGIVYRSMHLGYALHLMSLIYLVFIIYSCISLIRCYRRVKHKLDSDVGNPVETISRWTLTGAAVLSLQGVLTPFVIFSRVALLIAGPLILLAVTYFVSTFLAMGFNYGIQEVIAPGGVSDSADEADDDSADAMQPMLVKADPLSAEQIEQIESQLVHWRAMHGYRDNDLTIASLSRYIKVSRLQLSQFLMQQYHSTFRSWLSAVRIEESKVFLTEHPDYSNEFIAMECGFASRTHFQRLFKASEGVTPSEWKKSR